MASFGLWFQIATSPANVSNPAAERIYCWTKLFITLRILKYNPEGCAAPTTIRLRIFRRFFNTVIPEAGRAEAGIMKEMNADFNDPGSTPPASGVPDSSTEWQ